MYQYSYYSGPRRRRKKGIKNVFEEIMAENFTGLKTETYLSKGSTEGANKMNSKRSTLRCIIV